MTFQECITKFPIFKTYVGNYGYFSDEPDLIITSEQDIEKLQYSDEPPLEWENNSDYDFSFPFIIYEGENTFSRWYFSAYIVSGYLNETDEDDQFFPATYSEDSGWAIYNPLIHDTVQTLYFVPDYKLQEQLLEQGRLPHKIFGAKWMTEQVAYSFDKDKYLRGEIITNYKQLKEFMKEKI